MKRIARISIISILTAAVVLTAIFLVSRMNESVHLTGYDMDIPSGTNFIQAQDSIYFTYKAEIEVNGVTMNREGKETSLSTDVLIESKRQQDQIFRNMIITAFMDDSLNDFLVIPGANVFGVYQDVPQEINKSKGLTGLMTSRLTWLKDGYKNYTTEAFKARLQKPIRVKVTWDGGEEYAIIPGDAITLRYVKEPRYVAPQE